MQILAPTTDDADAVADLWVELAESQRRHGSHLLPAANRATVREAVVRHAVAGGLLAARVDGDLVGFVMFHRESGAYRRDVERGVVENLYVRPGYRNEGVGSALLSRAEAELREAGAAVLALEVMADNEAARRFYRRAGYAPHRLELEKPAESDNHSKENP